MALAIGSNSLICECKWTPRFFLSMVDKCCTDIKTGSDHCGVCEARPVHLWRELCKIHGLPQKFAMWMLSQARCKVIIIRIKSSCWFQFLHYARTGLMTHCCNFLRARFFLYIILVFSWSLVTIAVIILAPTRILCIFRRCRSRSWWTHRPKCWPFRPLSIYSRLFKIDNGWCNVSKCNTSLYCIVLLTTL